MKTAVVTGAARGIGRAIAVALAKDGYAVAAVARSGADNENAASLIKELSAYSPSSFYISADISSDADRRRIVDAVIEKSGKIDVLVNNAGIAPKERRDILQMSEESMDALLETNLKGTFFLTQYAANKMIDGGFGTAIINITSMSAYTSSVSRGEYCISKAGLSMVTTLFADRLAQYGIGVYEVRPGIIETDMTAVVKDKYAAMIDGGLLPISRMGKPDDVAKAVTMLADGALGYSTGEVINVDGGFHIRRL